MEGLSRRAFIAGAAATPLVLRLPRAAWAAGSPLRFFTAGEAAVVEAATARLIPGPTDDVLELGSPGAREANVVGYIDALLGAFDVDPPLLFAGGPFSDRAGSPTNDLTTFQPLTTAQAAWWRDEIAALQERYRAGIIALDAAAGGSFASATIVQQDLVLTQDQTGFRDLLFDHAIEGWLAIPEYGGNDEESGWVAVSFAGDAVPDGYTAAEVRESDGPDPVDPAGVTGQLLALLEGVFGA